MKKRILFLGALLTTVLLLGGCGLRTVDEMYSLPKRSEEFNHLQTAIDMAMVGLEYAAPLSGENQQTVQMADLDGDGVEEYLVFAKGNSEKPMQILIFSKDEEGTAQIMDVIESSGSAFEQVEYIQVDNKPGLEILVGRRVSDQVMRSLALYTFAEGKHEPLLLTGYSKFLPCDLDGDSCKDILVIQPGEANSDNAITVLYQYRNNTMERSVEAELSGKTEDIRRITTGKLHSGEPAVYIASALEDTAIITDIFAIKGDRFSNISISNESGTSVLTLRNYYVYGEDVDIDEVLELPSLIVMQPVSPGWNVEQQYLIRWYTMDIQGKEHDKFHSFHNYDGGWYLKLDSAWAHLITVEHVGNTYGFYVWDESYTEATALFTIFTLTGSDRETQALEDNRFMLHRTDSVVYAARLDTASEEYGITQDLLIDSFRLIYQQWKTGET